MVSDAGLPNRTGTETTKALPVSISKLLDRLVTPLSLVIRFESEATRVMAALATVPNIHGGNRCRTQKEVPGEIDTHQ